MCPCILNDLNDLNDCRPQVLHTLDTRVPMLPHVPGPHHEVPAGRRHRALHLQADLPRGLHLGRVEESVRQEKLEKRLLKIDLTRSSKYLFFVSMFCHICSYLSFPLSTSN